MLAFVNLFLQLFPSAMAREIESMIDGLIFIFADSLLADGNAVSTCQGTPSISLLGAHQNYGF